MIIRPYEPGDEKEILSLFEKVFGRPMSENYWRWRFANNPNGLLLIELAWDGPTLAAHYAVSPVAVSVEGVDFLTALSMTTMTHPDYRGCGLFQSLAESVYARMSNLGMSLVWGFPNRISHRGFIRELSWTDIYEIPMFRRVLAEGKPLLSPTNNIEALSQFDTRFDMLWNKTSRRHGILTKRDSNFLRWRYQGNPDQQYHTIGYCEDHELLGYAVYKRFGNELDLVDLLSTSDEVSVALILGIAHEAKQMTCSAINCWLILTRSLHRELEKLGFQNGQPVTYFGGKILRSDLAGELVYSFKNWYLTLGDSDVY